MGLVESGWENTSRTKVTRDRVEGYRIVEPNIRMIAQPILSYNHCWQMFNIFNLKKEIIHNYTHRGQDTISIIPPQDLDRINSASSYMWKIPLTFGSIYLITIKAMSLLSIPQMFNNPLKQSLNTNENITRTFKKAFKLQGLAICALYGFLIGLGLCQATKFNMFLKYQNLVNSYVQSKNREWKDTITFKDSTFQK